MPEGDGGQQENLLESADRYSEPVADVEAPRVLIAVLFTDIVGSTQLASALGDHKWRALVEQHHETVRAEIARHGGRVVDTAGDGFFARFDSPSLAVECALAAVRSVRRIGLRIRSGVHFGECVVTGGDVRGVTVHIGARIAAKATGGQVLVSSTVKDLLSGAGLRFADGGQHALKGVDGRWRLYIVQPRTPDVEADLPALIEVPREPVPWWKRRRNVIAAVTGLAVLIAAIGFAVTRSRGLSIVPADSIAVIDASSGTVREVLRTGRRPVGVVRTRSGVWVANSFDQSVFRIAPDGQVTSVPLGSGPTAVADGANVVWVADREDRTVARISPETGREVGTRIRGGNGLSGIAFAGGKVWITNSLDGSVWRINPATAAVERKIAVGSTPRGIVAQGGGVWVALEGIGTVARIDERGVVGSVVNVGKGPSALALRGRFLWVANTADGTVSRVDTSSPARVTATISVGRGPRALAVAAGKVWVANEIDESVTIVDERTARVQRSLSLGNAPMEMTAAGDTVWVSVRGGITAYQGGTLKVGTAFPLETLDPTFGWNPITPRIINATHDTLIAYKRVGGVEGATLGPDLAESLDPPSGDGKTYTFTLRKNLKWSDGTPVVASAVRKTFERMFPVEDSPGRTFFSIISGAARCEPRKPCDLSAGIVTDDKTGRIEFHLTKALPDFQYLLALPFASIVPPSAQPRDLFLDPIPGTGPYRIASAKVQKDAEGLVVSGDAVLERNPYFVARPPAQPAAYADRILISWGGDPKDYVAAVRAGTLDFTPDTEELSPEELAALGNELPARFHVEPIPVFRYLALNGRLAPFNKVEVRRAVNFAIDRGALAGSHGAFAALTCQVIPPNVSGYSPYCPYTTSPSATGLWHGPDLAQARRLVDASGTRGAEIVIAIPTSDQDQGRRAQNVAASLRAIGYRPRIRTQENPFEIVQGFLDGTGRDHISIEGWGLDYPSASSLFIPMLSCPNLSGQFTGETFNMAGFCSKSVDEATSAAIEALRKDAASAASGWAEADRRATDLAAWAPYATLRSGYLTSERVGNLLMHPVYNVLISQLWVRSR